MPPLWSPDKGRFSAEGGADLTPGPFPGREGERWRSRSAAARQGRGAMWRAAAEGLDYGLRRNDGGGRGRNGRGGVGVCRQGVTVQTARLAASQYHSWSSNQVRPCGSGPSVIANSSSTSPVRL